MGAVYRFLAIYEGLVYILLALGGLFALRWLWNSWREWRDSVFGLEREFAMRRMSQALIVSLFLLFLFFGELVLTSFGVPALPASDILATPTLDFLNQTANTLADDPAVASTAVDTDPLSSSDTARGCVPGELDITSPESGQEVRGTITLVGTVDIDNFGFYKYEVSPLDAGAWTTILASRQTVRNGDLGLWDTSTLTPGDYQLSLEVADNQGQLFPPCVISIRVVPP